MKGVVLKSTGSSYKVLLPDDGIADCRVRGQLRLKGLKTTNPVAVGDTVILVFDSKTGQYLITDIEERKNYIIRKSVNLSKKFHVIASNIDQAIILFTLHHPRTPFGFIDRLLVTCEAYDIFPVLILNKKDTWTTDDQELLSEVRDTYQRCGYNLLEISSFNAQDVARVKELTANKVSVIMGHSGTGKSTLMNALNPDLKIKTEEISLVHNQGKHTTTFPEMHPVGPHSWVIDTPGVREFGITDMHKTELSHYFPEIFSISSNCRFNNCLHREEPGCAVLQAVEDGSVPYTRYRSYCSIMDGETPVEYD